MAEKSKSANDTEGSKTTMNTAEQHADKAARTLDAKLSGPLAPLETALDGVFGSKAGIQLPADMKDLLVKIAPWLSLAAGILGILSAISFWQMAHRVGRFASDLGISEYMPNLGLAFWLSLVMLLLFSALALLAFPGLRAKKKVGWNLMFYSMVANIVYGVVSLFYNSGGFFGLLSALVMSAIGFYILFQIRDHYKV